MAGNTDAMHRPMPMDPAVFSTPRVSGRMGTTIMAVGRPGAIPMDGISTPAIGIRTMARSVIRRVDGDIPGIPAIGTTDLPAGATTFPLPS